MRQFKVGEILMCVDALDHSALKKGALVRVTDSGALAEVQVRFQFVFPRHSTEHIAYESRFIRACSLVRALYGCSD